MAAVGMKLLRANIICSLCSYTRIRYIWTLTLMFLVETTRWNAEYSKLFSVCILVENNFSEIVKHSTVNSLYVLWIKYLSAARMIRTVTICLSSQGLLSVSLNNDEDVMIRSRQRKMSFIYEVYWVIPTYLYTSMMYGLHIIVRDGCELNSGVSEELQYLPVT